MRTPLLLFCLVMMITGWYSCTKDTSKPVGMTCPAGKLSFTEDVKPIFTSYCAVTGCHNATTKQSGLNLSQYTDVVKAINQSGYNSLLCRIQGGDTCGSMMPLGGPKMPDSVITKIVQWKVDGLCN